MSWRGCFVLAVLAVFAANALGALPRSRRLRARSVKLFLSTA